jgi:hypothetical protein
MDTLFSLLGHDRTEVWYGAAETLNNLHTRWENTERFWEKRESLQGPHRLRIEMAGSHSLGFKEELKRMGLEAARFLIDQANVETYERSPQLFWRACNMLAFLGDRQAIPPLIKAIEQVRPKETEHGASPFAAAHALRAINKLTGRNYGDFGQDFDSMSGEAVRAVDWELVRRQLDIDF